MVLSWQRRWTAFSPSTPPEAPCCGRIRSSTTRRAIPTPSTRPSPRALPPAPAASARRSTARTSRRGSASSAPRSSTGPTGTSISWPRPARPAATRRNPHYVLTLHKVRLADGLDTSAVMADTTLQTSDTTFTFNSGPYIVGTGEAAITVNGQSRIYLNALRHMCRPALELYNGRIYVGVGSHGDNQPYHGLGVDLRRLDPGVQRRVVPHAQRQRGRGRHLAGRRQPGHRLQRVHLLRDRQRRGSTGRSPTASCRAWTAAGFPSTATTAIASSSWRSTRPRPRAARARTRTAGD